MTMAATYLPHLVAMVGAGGLGAALKPTFDFVLRRRERSDSVAMDLVQRLQARIDALELAGAAERVACAQQVEHQRELYEAKLSQLRQELVTYRSENQMLLMVLELAPEKSALILARMRQDRVAIAADA
jgi:hypothetical protein